MIELIVYNYLLSELDVPVYMEIPSNAPAIFVRIEKTGSSKSNYINSATFAVQSYADTMYNACALNEEVRQAMDGMIELGEVFSSKLNSDYNYTDETTKHYRYQAVYDIKY